MEGEKHANEPGLFLFLTWSIPIPIPIPIPNLVYSYSAECKGVGARLPVAHESGISETIERGNDGGPHGAVLIRGAPPPLAGSGAHSAAVPVVLGRDLAAQLEVGIQASLKRVCARWAHLPVWDKRAATLGSGDIPV